MTVKRRQAFGLPVLDQALGGGLLPGTLTVVAGATGVGKTQLGLTWAAQGRRDPAESCRGIVCDLASRGDSQNHAAYAQRLDDWTLTEHPNTGPHDPTLDPLEYPFEFQHPLGDWFRPFHRAGKRVTRRDLEADAWHEWKVDLARTLRRAAAWHYAWFVRGVRRVVFDGVEPTDRFVDSIQFELFEYLYHQVLRREADWLAREVFRERFRSVADQVAHSDHRYRHDEIGCLSLYTTPQVMLDDLVTAPISEGDLFANANTIIFMGRTKLNNGYGRALHVAKHRGSVCDEGIKVYRIVESGLEFL